MRMLRSGEFKGLLGVFECLGPSLKLLFEKGSILFESDPRHLEVAKLPSHPSSTRIGVVWGL